MGTYAPLRSTKVCQHCGYVLPIEAATCPRCGTKQGALALGGESDKKLLPASILCVLLGVFGGHRFYVGKTGTALLQLVTLGGCGLWMLYDLVMLVTGQFRDKEGNRMTEWT